MDKNAEKQLKIKTNTLKRNYKDYQSYTKEAKQFEEKLEKMKEENAEESSLNRMQAQLAETQQMLPNCKTRIEGAQEELQNFLSENEDNNEMKETEEWKLAEQTLAEVTAFVETI